MLVSRTLPAPGDARDVHTVLRRSVSLAAVAVSCLYATLLVACTTALAAPITVTLRVEGSTKTLFEGPIATSAETIETPSSGGPHPCDYSENGSSGGFANGGNPSGTPTTALRDAALAGGLAFDAEWFGTGVSNGNPGDFFVSQVGADVNETSAPFDSWGYAVNYTTAPVGGCQIALAPGSEVLWAYNYFNLSHLLRLSGPAGVNAGTPFTVHVTDGQTGEPISGAALGEVAGGVTTTIPSSPTTDASGNATIVLGHVGAATLKATRGDAVRSNGIAVCVHAGNDGSCGTSVSDVAGTPFPTAPGGQQTAVAEVARVVGVTNGHVYSRRLAPRVLKGMVNIAAGGTLREVRIRLERRHDGRCFNFSGSRARFVRARKCGTASFFSVGATQSFSYLLPARLPAGRYVYDIDAVGSTGNATKLVSGVSHVVFRVR
jgi:hypothetical protein